MAAAATFTATFTAHGTYTWVAPAGVTSVKAECWGGAGGGSSDGSGAATPGGGGGGEYAAEPALAVTAGSSYTVTVGAGNHGGGPGGQSALSGTASSFPGDSVTVTANGGTHGTTGGGGAGGTGSANTTHHNGGSGATGFQSGGASAGGGGGSSAGPAAAGGNGAAAAGTTSPGAGGTAPTGGGAGGAGGYSANASAGSAPGGGGGGAGYNGTQWYAGSGADGQVVITWTMTSPATLAANTAGGTYKWAVPTGIVEVDAACWGSGAGGFQTGGVNGGAGGGGGEYAAELSLAVTPGSSYTVAAGAGGADGANGNASTIAGDSVTVTAHGGSVASTDTTGGLGGTGSANTVHHNGGQGGSAGTTGGGGGGGSAAPGSAGNAGSAGVTTSGGAGATAVAGSGPGGNGGNAGASGSAPASGPGGGGGAKGLAGAANGAGAAGQITLTWGAAPFYPLDHPARARVPQVFSKGRATGNPGAPVRNPTHGPPFYPLRRPAKARPGTFRKGRTAGSAGAPLFIPTPGPPFYPLRFPARAPIPQNGPRGRTSGNPGAPVTTTPYIGQQVSATSVSDYGLLTITMTSTPGATLVVLAGWDLSTQATDAAMASVYVTDSAGNYWYHAGTSSSVNSGSRTGAWYCPNSRPVAWLSVSATTFVSSLAVTVIELANMPLYFSSDVAATNSASVGTSLALSPGTTGGSGIAFACFTTGATALSPSTPSPWSALPPVTAGAGKANPVEIFPYWSSPVAGATNLGTTWTVTASVPLSGVIFTVAASPPAPVQPNPAMPLLKVEAAFGFTPGDPSQPPPAWTDITARAIGKSGDSFISSTMGRQYELAQMEAGELVIAIDNHDGAFTPGNANSPYYPNVMLGTPVRVSAFWATHWYSVGYGWVERWPQEWPDLPQWGMSKMIATDAVAAMSSANMVSALDADILLDAPYVFIPASEQYTTFQNGLNPVFTTADAQGLLAANISQVNQRPGVYVDGTAATAATGGTTNLLGDADTGFGTTSISTVPAVSASGPGIVYTDPALPGPVSGSGVTVEFWVIIPTATSASLQPTVFSAFGPASNYGSAKPSLSLRVNSYAGSTMTITLADGSTVTASFNPNATAAQQIVLGITASSLSVYVNGALATTATLTSAQTTAWNAVTLGCPNYAYDAGLVDIGNFTAFDLAIYPYQLPIQRILSHYVTGFSGQQNTDATTRIAQVMSWANLPIARAGQSLFGAPPVTDGVMQGPAYSLGGQTAASAVDQIALNHTAMAFAAPSGALVYVHKWGLFNQAPAAVFGDSTVAASGEVPYLPAQSFDYDATYLYNKDQVTQQVGPNNTITVTAGDFASQAAYFLRSVLTQTIETSSDLDAYTQAYWLLAKYSQPSLRVAGVTIDAAANAAQAFPVVLALQQGQAVTTVRRPVGGAVISEDVLVQKAEHSIGPGRWQVSYQLSPYSPEGDVLQLDSPGFSTLGDSTLG